MGREAELAQVKALLREPAGRLLSLVGHDGVGKARLALQMARDLEQDGAFPNGVAWVNLAPVSTVDEAIAAIAATLGLTLRARAEAAEQLADAIGNRDLLLVLDNLEHVLPIAVLIVHLLQRASALRVLATSREPLRLPAEQVVPLGGLSATTGKATPVAPATLLFVERARQFVPDFRLTPQNQPSVEVICRQLAGVPLAIELAAAWSHVLTPQEIATEVRRSLDFLPPMGPRSPRTSSHSARSSPAGPSAPGWRSTPSSRPPTVTPTARGRQRRSPLPDIPSFSLLFIRAR